MLRDGKLAVSLMSQNNLCTNKAEDYLSGNHNCSILNFISNLAASNARVEIQVYDVHLGIPSIASLIMETRIHTLSCSLAVLES